MHGRTTRHRRIRRSRTNPTWWLGLAGLVLVLLVALTLLDSGPQYTTVQSTDTALESLSSNHPQWAERTRFEEGWWSIETAANGIVFVHHR